MVQSANQNRDVIFFSESRIIIDIYFYIFWFYLNVFKSLQY